MNPQEEGLTIAKAGDQNLAPPFFSCVSLGNRMTLLCLSTDTSRDSTFLLEFSRGEMKRQNAPNPGLAYRKYLKCVVLFLSLLFSLRPLIPEASAPLNSAYAVNTVWILETWAVVFEGLLKPFYTFCLISPLQCLESV